MNKTVYYCNSCSCVYSSVHLHTCHSHHTFTQDTHMKATESKNASTMFWIWVNIWWRTLDPCATEKSATQRKEIECESLTSGGRSRALRSSRCRCWDPPPCCLVFWEQTGPLNSVSCLLVQVPPAQMMARSHPQSRLLAIKICKMQDADVFNKIHRAVTPSISFLCLFSRSYVCMFYLTLPASVPLLPWPARGQWSSADVPPHSWPSDDTSALRHWRWQSCTHHPQWWSLWPSWLCPDMCGPSLLGSWWPEECVVMTY